MRKINSCGETQLEWPASWQLKVARLGYCSNGGPEIKLVGHLSGVSHGQGVTEAFRSLSAGKAAVAYNALETLPALFALPFSRTPLWEYSNTKDESTVIFPCQKHPRNLCKFLLSNTLVRSTTA